MLYDYTCKQRHAGGLMVKRLINSVASVCDFAVMIMHNLAQFGVSIHLSMTVQILNLIFGDNLSICIYNYSLVPVSQAHPDISGN